MRKGFFSLLLLGGLLISGGCFSVNVIEKNTAEKPEQEKYEAPAVMVVRTRTPVQVDGILDEAVWQQAPKYELYYHHPAGLPARTDLKMREAEKETGAFQLAMDDHYLYLALYFRENDVVDTNTVEQTRLYRNSDTAEFFIYPESGTPYFEFHVTPTGKRASFQFESTSYRAFDCIFAEPLMPGYLAAARVDGTLNNHRDTDQGWRAELAIPLAEVAKGGTPFDESQRWKIAVARYNYSYHFANHALYSFPKLPRPEFHLVEYYAPVKIVSEP